VGRHETIMYRKVMTVSFRMRKKEAAARNRLLKTFPRDGSGTDSWGKQNYGG